MGKLKLKLKLVVFELIFRVLGSLFGETFGAIFLFFSVTYVKIKSSPRTLAKEAFYASLFFITFLISFSVLLNILLPYSEIAGNFTFVSFLVFELIFGMIFPCYFICCTPSLKKYVQKLWSKVPKRCKNRIDVVQNEI